MPPKPLLGQGVFELGEQLPQPPPNIGDMDWDRRIAASRLIKIVTDVSPPDPSEVTDRDVRVMSPWQIQSGLYTPENKKDSDVTNAYRGVIFPADQFIIIARSPADLARHVISRTLKSRAMRDDKAVSDRAAKRAAGHELKHRLGVLTALGTSLEAESESLGIFSNELHGARNTGFYAHYSASNLQPIKATVEASIFSALDVAASTHVWDKEKLERARRALKYQLYGPDKRIKTWIGYTDMALHYAHARGVIIEYAKQRTEREQAKYQPYLDADK